MSAGDLCAFSDVLAAVPGYDNALGSNSKTNAKLQDLISSESELIHLESGRELIEIEGGARQFLLGRDDVAWGLVEIGDLAALDDAVVTLLSTNGTLFATCDNSTLVPRYGTSLNQRQPWEPITSLELTTARGAPAISAGQTLVVDGTFGFPSVPLFIKTACVNRVILRYVSDVGAGDQFGAALARLNLAAMFASARDAVAAIQRPLLG